MNVNTFSKTLNQGWGTLDRANEKFTRKKCTVREGVKWYPQKIFKGVG